jgi:hypothetical protein
MNTNEQTMIQAVRAHAMKHYESGWGVVVEAYDDGDVMEVVGLCGSDLEAIKAMAKVLGVMQEGAV